MYYLENEDAPERETPPDRKLESLEVRLQNYANRLETLQRQLERQLINNTPKHRRWLMRIRLFVRHCGVFFKDR